MFTRLSELAARKKIMEGYHLIDPESEEMGHLSLHQFKALVIFIFGFKPSKHEVLTMIHASGRCPSINTRDADLDKASVALSRDDCVSILLPRLLQARKDSNDKVMDLFRAFDNGAKGYLVVEDFESAFVASLSAAAVSASPRTPEEKKGGQDRLINDQLATARETYYQLVNYFQIQHYSSRQARLYPPKEGSRTATRKGDTRDPKNTIPFSSKLGFRAFKDIILASLHKDKDTKDAR